MRLYTHVFAYLSKFMTWYASHSRKRLLASFNEGSLQMLNADLDMVQETAALLGQQMQVYMALDARKTRLYTEDLRHDLKSLLLLHEEAARHGQEDRAAARSLEDQVQHAFHNAFQQTRHELEHSLKCMAESLRHEIIGSETTSMLTQLASRSLPMAASSKSRTRQLPVQGECICIYFTMILIVRRLRRKFSSYSLRYQSPRAFTLCGVE